MGHTIAEMSYMDGTVRSIRDIAGSVASSAVTAGEIVEQIGELTSVMERIAASLESIDSHIVEYIDRGENNG